jgi:hypothetical protein
MDKGQAAVEDLAHFVDSRCWQSFHPGAAGLQHGIKGHGAKGTSRPPEISCTSSGSFTEQGFDRGCHETTTRRTTLHTEIQLDLARKHGSSAADRGRPPAKASTAFELDNCRGRDHQVQTAKPLA